MEDEKTFMVYNKETKIKALKEISEFIGYWSDKEEKIVCIELFASGKGKRIKEVVK